MKKIVSVVVWGEKYNSSIELLKEDISNNLKGWELEVKRADVYDYSGLRYRLDNLHRSDIERFISRDANNRINKTEAKCIKEWVKSEKNFHIMRPKAGYGILVSGGLFGAKVGTIPDCEQKIDEAYCYWKKNEFLLANGYPSKGFFYGCDEYFLSTIWNDYIKDNHLAHVQKGIEYLKKTGQEIEVNFK